MGDKLSFRHCHVQATERVISDDLDFLISKAVNPSKADYAGGLEVGRVASKIGRAHV